MAPKPSVVLRDNWWAQILLMPPNAYRCLQCLLVGPATTNETKAQCQSIKVHVTPTVIPMSMCIIYWPKMATGGTNSY